MIKILDNYQTPNFEQTNMAYINSTIHPNYSRVTERLAKAITKLERQDIGWIDILTAMANITAEQGSEEKVAEALEATALSLKLNRRKRRNR